MVDGAAVIDGTIYVLGGSIDLATPDVVFVATYDPTRDEWAVVHRSP